MSGSDEEILSAESLRQLVEEKLQSSEAANAACRLAGLSIRGNAGQKRGRLLQFVSGPQARRRPGWLDLIMRAADAGATGPDDLLLSFFLICWSVCPPGAFRSHFLVDFET